MQAATINGAATLFSTLTVSGGGAVNLGSGTTTVGSGGTSGGNLVFSGTNASSTAGSLELTASNGLRIEGATGSVNDFALVNPAGNVVANVPTGTINTNFNGTLTSVKASISGYSGLTESAGAVTIDWSAANTFALTLNANLTTTTFSNAVSGETITVAITNTASNFTVTWGNSIKWVGGSQPVQTVGAHTDVWTIIAINGTFYGSAVQNF